MNREFKKLCGAVLTAFAMGMLIAKFFPWWGFIAAVVLAAVGIYLISDSC